MRKAIAVYHAPEGDAKECEMGGVTFHDGEAVELNSHEHGHMMSKFPHNPLFEIEVGEEVADEKPRRGRPPKVKEEPDQPVDPVV